MEDAEAALVRAWRLAEEDYTDEVFAEFELLLPGLISAGVAEADEHTWHFTARGIERAETLERE